MTRLATLGLGLCAVALCGVIWLEWAPGPAQAPAPPLRADDSLGSPVAPSSGNDDKVHDWVAITLARPLFEPSRRPPATDTQTSQPRLTGIVISTHLRDAIFMPPGGKRAVVVTPGCRFDGMLIESIDADGVVVVDAGGRRRLQPSFERQDGRPAPPPPVSVAVNDRPIFMLNDSTRPPDDIGPGNVPGLSFPIASGGSP